MSLKSVAKVLMPASLRQIWTNFNLKRLADEEAGRSPEDVFTDIYRKNRWGGKPGEFCSGSGSDEAATKVYVDWVSNFITQTGINSVLDIGCGDFRVGRQLVTPGVHYIGADIVKPLIERNNDQFGAERIRFVTIDAIQDPLPDADLCMIRQVLQHLSNAQILIILEKLSKFKFVLITEHHPAKPSQFNMDKPAGTAIRVYKGSGVYLDKPPYNRAARVVLETPVQTPLVRDGETLVTYLLTQT